MIQSIGTILFNYRKAIEQANELEQLARRLENCAKNDVASALAQVSGNWKGESASAFLQKGHKAQSDMEKAVKQLRNVAAAIRKAAETVRRTEERAREIALIQQNRSSGGGGGSR